MADQFNDKSLFGFELIQPQAELDQQPRTPIPKPLDDGTELPVGGRIGYTYELYTKARNEHQLIAQYRDISLYPEADAAIDDIINEAFVVDHFRSPVQINLEYLNIDEKIKKVIRDDFHHALRLLRFTKRSYDLFRTWYVDGRLYFQVLIDEKDPRKGIRELRPIDALKMKRIVKPIWEKETPRGTQQSVPVLKGIEEWYEYSPDKQLDHGIKLSKDSIIFCPSGVVDKSKGMILGYLDKAIKPFNNLRAMEDALIVYRLARAPERRIFYIDVGGLPKIKAEQYLRDMMNRYRNRIDYDPTSGQIRDSRKYMSVLEDFWLPRRDGQKATEIDTLPGGENLGELTDVEYFKEKLYQSLNVPASRLQSGEGFQLGRSTEISRDELKFSKFVNRLRQQFAELFNEILRIQLSLKGICTAREFDDFKQYIKYDFIQDMHFKELKDLEMMTERLGNIAQAAPYAGKFFSVKYLRRHVLGQTEEEIIQIDKEIMDEIAAGIIKNGESESSGGAVGNDGGQGIGTDEPEMGELDPGAAPGMEAPEGPPGAEAPAGAVPPENEEPDPQFGTAGGEPPPEAGPGLAQTGKDKKGKPKKTDKLALKDSNLTPINSGEPLVEDYDPELDTIMEMIRAETRRLKDPT